MQSQNPFFDDLARVTTGAMGTMAGAAREFEATARERMKEWLGGLDMVSREEFEAVKAMAVGLREELDAMKAAAAPAPLAASDDVTPAAAAGGAGPGGEPTL